MSRPEISTPSLHDALPTALQRRRPWDGTAGICLPKRLTIRPCAPWPTRWCRTRAASLLTLRFLQYALELAPLLFGEHLVDAVLAVAQHGAVILPGVRSEEHTSELQSLRHLVC